MATTAETITLIETASSWCSSHGILMGARDRLTKEPLMGKYIFEPAPFSLFPTLFSKSAFALAYQMAKPFNSMVHNVASDTEWLLSAIQVAAQGDSDFTGRLVQLAQEVLAREARNQQPRAQKVVLGILRYVWFGGELEILCSCLVITRACSNQWMDLCFSRSDYMLHGSDSIETAIPLQVELNTIASSFGCLSSKVTKMHQNLQHLNDRNDLPDNGAAQGIANGLATALQEYNRQRTLQLTSAATDNTNTTTTDALVVMVVQPGETNSCDQRDLEFLLKEEHGVRLIRRTLEDLAVAATHQGLWDGLELYLTGDDGTDVVAGVVYYRAGYTPNDYPSDLEWAGRAIVEHSAAIKCPDVFYHIVGAKKIQQALAQQGVLRQFCDSNEDEELLSSCFAGLYALGDGDDSQVVEMALANPHGYVLKPQREGGGNNLYDDDLVQALKQMSHAERGAFILMEKICPPSTEGSLVRGGEVVYKGDCVCELGVFGVTLREYGGRTILDKAVGHILRAKSVTTDEGGVAAGYAFLSSPKLV